MSEPKVVLLGGNRGRWIASERASEASTMSGVEGWVFAFSGGYIQNSIATSRDILQHDIVIANSNSTAIKNLLKLSANRPAGCKWVTLIEGDALDYIKPRPYVRELFDNSDLVVCINKYTLDFFSKFTTSPVVYIGMPYPAEEIRALSTPIEKRRKEIFLNPMFLSRWLEYFCVKDLGIPVYGYEKRLTRKPYTLLKNIQQYASMDPMYFFERVKSLYKDTSIRIEREETLPDFFKRNGSAYLWLNLDQRYTWGRYVLDAAALQVPIITTRSTGHAEDFFPMTMLENEFEIEKAVELVKRLFKDPDFYNEVAHVPIESFEEFRPEKKKMELLKALSK